MKILTLVTFCVLFGLIPMKARALGLDEIRLLEVSSSGKSVAVDRGELEKIKDGAYASFFIQAGTPESPKIFLIAEGKLIKNYPKKSVWYLEKVYQPKLIMADLDLLILQEHKAVAGRSFTQKRKHIVMPEGEYKNATDYKNKNENNVPDRLVLDKKNYDTTDELFDIDEVPEADQLVESYEELRVGSGKHMSDEFNDESSVKYFVGNTEVKLGDLKRIEDKKLFESLTNGLTQKINSQKYTLANGLYQHQKKVGFRDINDEITMTSVYDEVKEKAKAKEEVDKRVEAKKKRDGENWSADMDDDTLRRYFIRTGLQAEARRREIALNELEGHELMFHYSGSTTDHTTSADPNYRNLGYNLGLAYDLHLARTNKNLKQWSVQFLLERGVTDYDVGAQNARGEEGYYGAYLNYYFYNNPLTLNDFILLTGMGIKAGSIDMGSPSLSKEYSYQVLSLPSFQLLSKYRFRSGDLSEDTVKMGLSINFGITYDMKRLSVVDSLDDDINGKMSVNDLRYLVGMSVYF